MENQQTQPTQNPSEPVAPVQASPNVSSVSPQQSPDPSQPAKSLGMFGRRMGRLSYFLGGFYALLPLVIVAILLIISHFVMTPSSTNLSSGMYSSNMNSQALSSSNSGSGILNVIAIIVGIASVIMIIPISISLQIRRWHDLDKSGWFILLGFIPFASFFVGLYLLFAPGKLEPNQYGPQVSSNKFLVVLGFKPPTT